MPGVIGLLFGLALAVIVTLAGPLALFNPWFVSALQQRHAVAEAFDTSQAEVDRVTGELLSDIYRDGPFTAAFAGGTPLLDESERSHMTDVARLVRLLAAIAIVALLAALVTGWLLRREPERQGRIMAATGSAIGAVAVGLALVFALAFDLAFTVFHELLVPPGTWQFAQVSNLITLFPEPFWFDASLIAGATILVAAVLVSLAGVARWRGRRTDDPATLL